MEIIEKQSTKFDNVSLTACRIIYIFQLLLDNSLNEREISKKLLDASLSDELLSSDTISIYINTLRALGNNINKATKTTNYKYVLSGNSFLLSLDKQEIITLLEAV